MLVVSVVVGVPFKSFPIYSVDRMSPEMIRQRLMAHDNSGVNARQLAELIDSIELKISKLQQQRPQTVRSFFPQYFAELKLECFFVF